MAFNIYFAGGLPAKTDEWLKQKGGNRLFNQLYERNTIGNKWVEHKKEQPKLANKLLIDSSAYSAHTKGSEVDIDKYIEYLNQNVGMFDAIAELDKIPGEFRQPKTRLQLLEAPEISWNNYLYMRERVVDKEKLLPIFHMGEDFKWLQLMLDTTFENDKHIEYIGISPANDSVTKQKDKWMEKVFTIIKDSKNPNVKTHAFGMTVLEQLERHPFYSADSTSPLLSGAMGNVFSSRGLISFARKDGGLEGFKKNPKSVQEEVERIVTEAGFTVESLVDDYVSRISYNCQFTMDWARDYKFRGIRNRQKTLFKLT